MKRVLTCGLLIASLATSFAVPAPQVKEEPKKAQASFFKNPVVYYGVAGLTIAAAAVLGGLAYLGKLKK